MDMVNGANHELSIMKRQAIRRFAAIFMMVATVLVTEAWAGNLSVEGKLAVSSNLTAQSDPLTGITRTNQPIGFRAGILKASC
jgi:hypothetical protein